MKYLVIQLHAQTAAYRIPEFQSYHKSFRLPPPTTIIGLAGAALGLGPLAAQTYFNDADFRFGISGTHEGSATDLWKYDNFKGRGVLKKEILYGSQLYLVFGHSDETKLAELSQAFLSPIYALSLGYSDALVKVVATHFIENEAISRKLEFCLIDKDIIAETITNTFDEGNFSLYMHDSMQYNLPTQFTYEKEYGVRKVSARKQFTFVGNEMTLNFDIKGIQYENRFIPIFAL
ncbi:MAG: CRISPR-associated protein Cas5 [Bacteroidia bacterium]